MTLHSPGKDALAVTSGPLDPRSWKDPPERSAHALLGGPAMPCAGGVKQFVQSVFTYGAGSGGPKDDGSTRRLPQASFGTGNI